MNFKRSIKEYFLSLFTALILQLLFIFSQRNKGGYYLLQTGMPRRGFRKQHPSPPMTTDTFFLNSLDQLHWFHHKKHCCPQSSPINKGIPPVYGSACLSLPATPNIHPETRNRETLGFSFPAPRYTGVHRETSTLQGRTAAQNSLEGF